ncbi:ABC transporter ATP-binding protein [Paenibacillus sp. TRM 82003]|uniref:ABC transporter ATP-binding protein n=1 Tax=Kineococcus sp. TRM81007 TaxID=2925831 RepID=UPI001F58A68B|nr:ABC transporter ATP-binding protein [Kineococcus sp. TRM81007]MCI2238357.1 ABC transporter ATP-binding protein [Kineococcus sp. TRM81007]MCI3922129.1 ABC transporter ATP-binding protein [Paenibacillus sp. TRM 82003]
MIEAIGLTKRYGEKTAVDGVTFTVHPGRVTGFLGPNGAGKSTTMRMIMGLDRPSAGTVHVNGEEYARHRAPLGEVGALLEAKAVHPGRSAREHLLAQAATHGIGRRRVEEVVELAGLASVARERVGTFSLGMGQRLGIAAALLGDPHTLILDEPVNGLDPEGVLWVRTLLRDLAAQGRTVFLSSHLMSEMALTADHLLVVGRGRVIADASVAEIVARTRSTTVRVRTPDTAQLEPLLRRRTGVEVVNVEHDVLEVTGSDARQIAATAAAAGLELHELTPVHSSLEQAYMQLTAAEVEYRSPGAHETTAPTRPTSGTPR